MVYKKTAADSRIADAQGAASAPDVNVGKVSNDITPEKARKSLASIIAGTDIVPGNKVTPIESNDATEPSWRTTDGNDEPSLVGLHPNVQRLINDLCKSRQVPTEFYLAPMLAAVSVAAGSRVSVESGEYTNRLNLLVAVIAPSSSNKSTPAADIFAPLESINDELMSRAAAERTIYEMERERRAKDKKNPDLTPLTPPIQHQIIISNITEDARRTLLKDNPHGLLQYNDELDTFLSNLGKYTKSNELAEIITIHEGRNVVVNRVGRPAENVKKPFFSLFGTIQPRIAESRLVTEEAYTSGFTPRFLLFKPRKISYKNKPIGLNRNALTTWAMWLVSIYKNESIRLLTPNADALRAHDIFYEDSGDIMERLGEDSKEKSVIGKARVYVWKLAAIAHLLNDAAMGETTDTITAAEMNWAIALAKYVYRRHVELLERDTMPSQRAAIANMLQAFPGINQAEFAKLVGMSHAAMRKMKSRLTK